MKIEVIKKSLLVLCLAAFSQFAVADDASAAKTIASILVDLNHFPSDAQKAELMAISNDASTSAEMKAIAKAVHDLQHAATAADKAELGNIIASSDADATAKALAEVVVGINHMPSADAKTTLQAML